MTDAKSMLRCGILHRKEGIAICRLCTQVRGLVTSGGWHEVHGGRVGYVAGVDLWGGLDHAFFLLGFNPSLFIHI